MYTIYHPLLLGIHITSLESPQRKTHTYLVANPIFALFGGAKITAIASDEYWENC